VCNVFEVKEAKTVEKTNIALNGDFSNEQNAIGFTKTGGLHDIGIFKADGTMVAFSEDVDRHNTVDKVIGEG
jgi:formate dehydrogenase accessory protein FdhD